MERARWSLVVFVVFVAFAACKKPLPSHRVDVLEFKGFTLAVPVGWNQVDEPGMVKRAGPNGFALVPSEPASGFQPSVLIQQLELPADGIDFMAKATADACTAGVQQPLAASTKTSPGASKTWEFGTFHGCDVEVFDPDGPQSARQLSFTDGTITVSIVCNRDKAGAPAIDAACEAMAKAVTRR